MDDDNKLFFLSSVNSCNDNNRVKRANVDIADVSPKVIRRAAPKGYANSAEMGTH
jgi:hypothetical protein